MLFIRATAGSLGKPLSYFLWCVVDLRKGNSRDKLSYFVNIGIILPFLGVKLFVDVAFVVYLDFLVYKLTTVFLKQQQTNNVK